MKIPKISVLMTIYNHENYLKYSINSILKQSFKNWELIAIDNGSTDNTKKILKSFRDKRIKKIFLKKNIGRTNCLNYGLDFCRGEYIAIQDSDDISLSLRLEKQLQSFNKNKDLYLVATNCQLVNEKNKIVKKEYINYKNKNLRELLYKNIIAHSTVMYKKSLISKVGKYPRNFKYAQDYAFYLKVFKKFKIFIIQDTLLKARLPHENSETFRVSKTKIMINEKLQLIKWSSNYLRPTTIEKLRLLIEYYITAIKKVILF